jgi:predicted RNase H-like HicB family nuclease
VSGKEVVDEVSYRVLLELEDNVWVATSPDVPGAITQGRSLRGAIYNIKEAIALMLDLPERVEVNVEPDLVSDLKGVYTSARNARIDLDEAQRSATITLWEAVKVGRSTGLSLRDIAEVTGVTFQRVAQVEQALDERLAAGIQ